MISVIRIKHFFLINTAFEQDGAPILSSDNVLTIKI
jgi:hypothetical protein